MATNNLPVSVGYHRRREVLKYRKGVFNRVRLEQLMSFLSIDLDQRAAVPFFAPQSICAIRIASLHGYGLINTP